MSSLTIRLDEKERNLLKNYAEFYGISMASALKEAFFEKIEDEIDAEKIMQYEKDGKNEQSYTLDEVRKELGI